MLLQELGTGLVQGRNMRCKNERVFSLLFRAWDPKVGLRPVFQGLSPEWPHPSGLEARRTPSFRARGPKDPIFQGQRPEGPHFSGPEARRALPFRA